MPSVGHLIEALDTERLALAEHLGVSMRNVREQFHRSFDVPLGPVAEMATSIHRPAPILLHMPIVAAAGRVTEADFGRLLTSTLEMTRQISMADSAKPT